MLIPEYKQQPRLDMTEFLTTTDIPCLRKTRYSSVEKSVQNNVKDVLHKFIKFAIEEEIVEARKKWTNLI